MESAVPALHARMESDLTDANEDANEISYDHLIAMIAMASHEVGRSFGRHRT